MAEPRLKPIQRLTNWILLWMFVIPASCNPSDFDFHKTLRSCEDIHCGYKGEKSWARTSIPSANCRCDEKCTDYGDCCYDMSEFRQERHSPYQCEPVGTTGVYMKTECGNNWKDADISKACKSPPLTDPLLATPVTSKYSGITYKNTYCAVCNNEASFSVWDFQLYVYPYDNEDLYDIVPTKKHEIIENLYFNTTAKAWGFEIDNVFHETHRSLLLPNNSAIRQCNPQIINQCEQNWENSTVRNLCESYTYVVYHSEYTYRNPHCAQCNGIPIGNTTCIQPGERGGIGIDIIPLRKIFSAQSDGRCNADQGYDFFKKVCRSLPTEVKMMAIPSEEMRVLPTNSEHESNKCNNIIINAHFYEELNEDELLILPYNKTLPKQIVNITNEGELIICGENLGISYKVNYMEYGNRIISFIGYTLSIFFLLIHLIIFASSPRHNLSKNTNASLSISLIFSYIALLIGNSFKGLICYFNSIILCYLLLTSFAWMLTISYDCWRVIRLTNRTFKLQSGKQWVRFLMYSLFSWLTPAVLLAVAVFLDMSLTVPSDWRPLFGVHSCWFGQQKPLIIFFVSPFILVMMLNLGFFVTSAYTIYQIRNEIRSLPVEKDSQYSYENDFRIYKNLALTMGLTWIVALLAMALDNIVLWYIFTFLNSFQGVFIFISFSCNLTLYKKLKRKCTGNITLSSKISSSVSAAVP